MLSRRHPSQLQKYRSYHLQAEKIDSSEIGSVKNRAQKNAA